VEEDNAYEEDTGQAEEMCSLPLDNQKNVVPVDKMENADAALTAHENCLPQLKTILKKFF
jgi:hypothetical protein